MSNDPIKGLSVEVCPVPVLSTCHITASTNAMLGSTGERTPWGHCAKYEYGYFLSIPTEDAPLEPAPPSDLQAIFVWARANEFGWIRLDADGSHEDALASYDW